MSKMSKVQASSDQARVSVQVNGHSSAIALPETPARFAALVAQWRNETGPLSSVTQKAMHPAYQKIIGLGQPAIPLILQELQARPSPHWFWALDALAESPPVELEGSVNMSIEDVTQFWLQWGKARRYIQ